jgi:uncharacterized protein (TIGR00725 family)
MNSKDIQTGSAPFPIERRRMVAVIGDARIEAGGVKDLLAGFRVLTGGMGGVMEAACRGARRSSAYALGDTVGILPGSDPASGNQYLDIVIPTNLDHARNSIVAQADAVVAVGGGAGTLSEIALAWVFKRLVVALRVDGWSGKLAGQRVDDRIRYPEIQDDQVFGAIDAEEAVGIVASRIRQYRRQHGAIKNRG